LCLWFYQAEECTTVSKLLEKICASYSKGAEATDDALNVRLHTLATPCRRYASLVGVCMHVISELLQLCLASFIVPHLSEVNGIAHGARVKSGDLTLVYCAGPDQGASASQQTR